MRTLTFLFSDLREYTAFVERHGDVAATTLIADYRRFVRAEVARAQGAEIKTEGDSFYVVFEGATEAVRCGIAILQEADRYSRGRPDRPMRVGVGIHAGEPQPHEGQYVGGAVIVAARLAQSAQAGELLVSDVVRGLLPKSALPPMQQREGVVLKGIEDPPRVFAVSWTVAETPPAPAASRVGEAAAAPDRSMLCPQLIGRDTALETLRGLLEEAAGGHGRTALLAGEAGVGKSSVLRRFLELAEATGARVLRGECTEIEARRPFGPFIDAFAAAALPLPPALAQGAPGAMPAEEIERYRAHAGFADAITEEAERAPLVVAIEDIHWADEATLELIPYLARKLRDRRVLLLCTYRDDELHRLHPLRVTLAELKRSRLVSEVRLPRLSEDEVAMMMQVTLGLSQAPTTAWRQAIYERCEGNPFFIEEVLRALVERGDLEYRDGAWLRAKEVSDLAIPDSVRDAVQQRLAAFTASARRALQVAAVIGQRFDFELLQRVAGTGEAELLAALRQAIDDQLVEEDRGKDDAYRFRHALTRESVLAELMRRERKLIHHDVAQALEATASDPEARAEELAYHFDRGGDEQRAYTYHVLAARQADRVYAYRRAAEHLERAIELAPRGDPSVGSLQLSLARSSEQSLDMARAARAAEAARATFRSAGDALHEGEALAALGLIERRAGDTAAGNRDLEQAVALVEPFGPTPELATTYANLARACAIDERPDAVAIARRALDLSTQAGSLESRLDSLTTLAVALGRLDDPEEALRRLHELIDLANEHGLAAHADGGYSSLGLVLGNLGARQAQIDATMDERVEHARAGGLRTDLVLLGLAGAAFERADWDEFLRLVEEGRSDAYFSLNREGLEATVLIARDGPAAGMARLDQLLRRFAKRLSPQDIVLRANVATLVTSLVDDHRATLEHAEPVIRLRTRFWLLDWVCIRALCAAQRLGDRDAATRWSEVALGRSSHFGHGAAAASRAMAEGVRAALAEDLDLALDRYLAAARELEEGRAHAVSTFIRKERAEILAQRGDRDAARAELEAILVYWRRARATWYIGQLRAWAAERGIALADEATTAHA